MTPNKSLAERLRSCQVSWKTEGKELCPNRATYIAVSVAADCAFLVCDDCAKLGQDLRNNIPQYAGWPLWIMFPLNRLPYSMQLSADIEAREKANHEQIESLKGELWNLAQVKDLGIAALRDALEHALECDGYAAQLGPQGQIRTCPQCEAARGLLKEGK